MNTDNGYSLIELLLGLLIISILLPSIFSLITQPLRLIRTAFQQQLMIQDHLFIDHIIRHDLSKTIHYAWTQNKLQLRQYDNTMVYYYINQKKLKRYQGNTRILTKQYLFNSFEYFSSPPHIIINSEFLPITIALP
jgi:prepilin-type N-terminal cleavage/methylation domain-containing protein